MDLRDKKSYVHAYDQPLLALLESIQERGTPRGPDVAILQQSVAILIDLDTPAARRKLQELLAGRYDAFQATVAAGLPRAETQAVAVIAQPLLESPYERLSSYAAFAMGKFARKEATPVLLEILTREDRYRLPLRTLAGWYLMKIEGQAEQGAQAIGNMVK
jgi:HEAT repeat protein